MKAITYRNTKTTVPGWVDNIHIGNPIGYAYETDTHFIHFYGKEIGFHVLSIKLTTTQQKQGTLIDWVKSAFGAEDIQELNLEVGNSVKGVWRPSLYYYDHTYQALEVSEHEMKLSENSLRLLVEKLDDIFIYIEPDTTSLNTFSHKTRELLILACTEVENFWQYYMTQAGHAPQNGYSYTTNDYVKLISILHLKEYEFTLKTYSAIPPLSPFGNWDTSAPTSSLEWYDAYNKTKHERDKYFSKATLLNCINAVVANLVMHCVKFSPFPMFEQKNTFSSLINQHFEARFSNSDHKTFYVHHVHFPEPTRDGLFIFDSTQNNHLLPFKTNPLIL